MPSHSEAVQAILDRVGEWETPNASEIEAALEQAARMDPGEALRWLNARLGTPIPQFWIDHQIGTWGTMKNIEVRIAWLRGATITPRLASSD
jgi:hypothetical protein